MIRTLFPLFILFVFHTAYAQEIHSVRTGCSFSGVDNDPEKVFLDPSDEASAIVQEILEANSIFGNSNILLKESNVDNAMATTVEGKRYILYNSEFLDNFKRDARTKWAAYCVMAHEIGHHMYGHDFSEKDPQQRRAMELQADTYAGAVLRGLGATRDESVAGIDVFRIDADNDFYPSKSLRRAAIMNGWSKKDENIRRTEGEQAAATPAKTPPEPEPTNTNAKRQEEENRRIAEENQRLEEQQRAYEEAQRVYAEQQRAYEEQQRAYEAERQLDIARQNMWNLVSLDESYSYDDLAGGIWNAVLYVDNNNDYAIDNLWVAVEYVRATGDVYKTVTVKFSNVPANHRTTFNLPTSERGMSLNTYKTYLYCSALGWRVTTSQD